MRQTRQIDRGSQPRMPLLVMTIIENDRPRPIVHANRFGLAETQSGGWPRVIRRASMPIGLARRPTVTRIRNSTKNSVEAIWSGT